jgi:hypothetical protein
MDGIGSIRERGESAGIARRRVRTSQRPARLMSRIHRNCGDACLVLLTVLIEQIQRILLDGIFHLVADGHGRGFRPREEQSFAGNIRFGVAFNCIDLKRIVVVIGS